MPHKFIEIGICCSGIGTNENDQFQGGVFQGCTLSTILFDAALNTTFDKLPVMTQSHDDKFTTINRSITKITGYADDIVLLTEFNSAKQ